MISDNQSVPEDGNDAEAQPVVGNGAEHQEQDRQAIRRDTLVGLWAEIEPFVDSSSSIAEATLGPLTDAQRVMLSRWRTLFDDEIKLVRGARNEIVHSPTSLSGDSLDGAVEVAAKLRKLLFDGLANPVGV